MPWKPEYRVRRNRCAQCGQMFEANRKTQKACSVACSVTLRKDALAQAGRKGGEARRVKVLGDWHHRLTAAGLTPEQLALVLAFGRARYHAGHVTGRGCGQRRGWAEALGEHDAREVWA